MRVLNVYVSCRLEYIVPQFSAHLPPPPPSNKAGWAFTVNCSGIIIIYIYIMLNLLIVKLIKYSTKYIFVLYLFLFVSLLQREF